MNALRIIFQRLLTSHMLKRMGQVQIPQMTEEEKKSLYQSYPCNRDSAVPFTQVLAPMFFFCAAFIGIASIINVIHYIVDIRVFGKVDEIGEMLGNLLMLPIGLLLVIPIKYYLHYMANTGCYYYEDYIIVKRCHRQDYRLTYEELEKYIKRKKITIHRGRLELPYSKGMIPLYTYGDPHVKDSHLTFLNEKCNIQIPKLDKRKRNMIKSIPMGLTIYVQGMMLFLFLFYMTVPAFLGDEYVIGAGIQDYFNFVQTYCLDILGAPLVIVVVGIVLRTIFFIRAWFEFRPYKKLIKVR